MPAEMTMSSLAGKVAAVTGATSGIGLATAEAFVQQGATVFCIHYSADKLAPICKRLGERAIPLPIDVTKPDDVDKMMPAILKEAGRLDFFVVNAGKYVGGDVVDNKSDELATMLDVNVKGAVLTSKAAASVMKSQGAGYIMFISSVAGLISVPGEAGYCGSKAFVENFANSFRREVCGSGVRVGVISPGPVDGKIAEENWTKEKLAVFREKGAFLKPEDVARVVMFMATTEPNTVVSDITLLPASFNL